MKKVVILVVIILAILILVFGRSADDSSEIEAVIIKMTEAGKNGEYQGVTEYVSIEYRDDYGATYIIVKKLVENLFQKFNKFDTKYKNLSVSVDQAENGDKTAAANLDIHITGYQSGVPVDIIGTEDLYQNITVHLKKTKLLGWKITKSEGFDNIIEEGF